MKRCTKCQVKKQFNEFSQSKTGKYNLQNNCKICVKKYDAENYQKNKNIIKSQKKEFYQLNKEILIKRAKDYYCLNKKSISIKRKLRHKIDPRKILLRNAYQRSKEKKLAFDITLDDIVVPEFCPIFGIKLYIGNNEIAFNSPSLDRLIPELGYVKGNVYVISNKANTIKNIGNSFEHRQIADWIDKNTCLI